MKISRLWLQNLFSEPLPPAEELERALTFHAFEIDGVEMVGKDHVLDVKVTPNRGHDCLSHRGIAKELAAILKMPLKNDPFEQSPDLSQQTDIVTVSIDTKLCSRYIAGYVKGVKVGPSPDWLRERLEAVGQRSINNVVDATNFVMFHLGQPLHAFDAGKLSRAPDSTEVEPRYAIEVRPARAGENMLALDEKEYTLNESMLVIADANTDTVIGIAGVKGGMPAGITEATTNILLESANFDGVSTRKTAQALKLRTDASARYEQVISPELASYGMRTVANMIHDLAGGEILGFVDVYPNIQEKKTASVSVEKINQILGSSLTGVDVGNVFERLGFGYKEEKEVFDVVSPFERLDLDIAEDLVEEVGRIVGYDHVPPALLSELSKPIEINKNFYWAEKIREFLTVRGFSEVFTSVFAEQGERVVLNKVDGVKPHMRNTISHGLEEALERNVRNKELLGLTQVKLFEIGTVWKNGGEEVVYDLAVEKVKKEKSAEDYKKELDEMLKALPENPTAYDNLPLSQTERYEAYSKYPYIVRDVAFWTPAGADENGIQQAIKIEAGELCIKISQFDRFEKDGKISLAYRLIFQSFDRTLVDDEVSAQMEKVYTTLKSQGFEIR